MRPVAREARAAATSRRQSLWRRPWTDVVAYDAALWSLAYGVLGVYWWSGGRGFPFGPENDRGAHLSLLGAAPREAVAAGTAVIGFLGLLTAIAMARRVSGALRTPLLIFGWSAAFGLAVAIPDYRILTIVAYTPILIVGAPFGWPGDANIAEALPWPVVNQALCMLGGVLWGLATLVYQRATGGACTHCGRTDVDGGWSADVSVRRGRGAVGVAIIVPFIYAATRWAWALGFPLGISEEFYAFGREIRLWWNGAALATLALLGALLTLGLIRPWGERFPGWLPWIGGRRVPPALVLVPVTVVALIVTSAGLMFVRFAFSGTFRLGEYSVSLRDNPGALLPELLWPLWGISLAVAALAYYYRTRRRCDFCGRS